MLFTRTRSGTQSRGPREASVKNVFAPLLGTMLMTACAAGPAAPGPNVEAPGGSAREGALTAVRSDVSSHNRLDPALVARLDRAGRGDAVDMVVRLVVAPLREASLPQLEATIEVGADKPAYTLNGRPAAEDEMARLAESTRIVLDQNVHAQMTARRELVERAIADTGIGARVTGHGMTWFQANLPAEEARRTLETLGPRVRQASLAADERATTSLRNDLHDTDDAGTDPLDDGDDGALENMGIIDFAHGYGMRGQNIGIWHCEGFAPYKYRADLKDAGIRLLTNAHWQPVQNGGLCRYNDECCGGTCSGGMIKTCSGSTDCPTGDIRSQEHATLVALMAHSAAPDATVYHAATDIKDCMLSDKLSAQTTPPIYVGAQSWSQEGSGASDNRYNVLDTCNGEWDDYIAASRIAHFHSSGNFSLNNVGSPARAYNVIGVGNYNHEKNAMTVQSGSTNPDTLVEKPEIVAPGTGITASPGWTRTGSSISSPLAAGFATDMMSGSAFFRNQPQAIKAWLISGAHDVYGGDGFDDFRGFADGAGRISYLDTYFYRWGKIYNGPNNGFFSAANKITETRTLEAGKRYSR